MEKSEPRDRKTVLGAAFVIVLVLWMSFDFVHSIYKGEVLANGAPNREVERVIESYSKRVDLEAGRPGITAGYRQTIGEERQQLVALLAADAAREESLFVLGNRVTACKLVAATPGEVPGVVVGYCSDAVGKQWSRSHF